MAASRSREAIKHEKATGESALDRIVTDLVSSQRKTPTNKFEEAVFEAEDVHKKEKIRSTLKTDTFRTSKTILSGILHSDNPDALDDAINNLSCWEHHGGFNTGNFTHFSDTLTPNDCSICTDRTQRHSRSNSSNCFRHCSEWIRSNRDVVTAVRQCMHDFHFDSNELSNFLLKHQRIWGKSGLHENAQLIYFLPTASYLSFCSTSHVHIDWVGAKDDSPHWRRVCQNVFAFATGIPKNRFVSVGRFRRKGAMTVGPRAAPSAPRDGQISRGKEVKVFVFPVRCTAIFGNNFIQCSNTGHDTPTSPERCRVLRNTFCQDAETTTAVHQ